MNSLDYYFLKFLVIVNLEMALSLKSKKLVNFKF